MDESHSARTGERPDERTEQFASDLREQAENLNYATLGPHGLTKPQTVHVVLGSLSEAAYGLGKTLDQMGEFLEEELEAERLVSGDEDGPELGVSQARDELAEAVDHAQELSNALERARHAIGLLSTREPSPANPAERRGQSAVADATPAALAHADAPMPIGKLLPSAEPLSTPPTRALGASRPLKPTL